MSVAGMYCPICERRRLMHVAGMYCPICEGRELMCVVCSVQQMHATSAEVESLITSICGPLSSLPPPPGPPGVVCGVNNVYGSLCIPSPVSKVLYHTVHCVRKCMAHSPVSEGGVYHTVHCVRNVYGSLSRI